MRSDVMIYSGAGILGPRKRRATTFGLKLVSATRQPFASASCLLPAVETLLPWRCAHDDNPGTVTVTLAADVFT